MYDQNNPFWQQTLRTPMYGYSTQPLVTGPMNVNMPDMAQAMMALGGNTVMGSLMSQFGKTPTQLIPMQNVYNQQAGTRFMEQNSRAMEMMRGATAAQLQGSIMGLMRIGLKRSDLTEQEEQFANKIAQIGPAAAPYLSAIIGPGLTNQLFGAKGNPMAMASAMHRAGNTLRDPITGRTGWSGATAAQHASDIFETYYGPKGNRTGMKGLASHEVGEMFSELAYMGMAPGTDGSMTDRMRTLGRTSYGDADYSRMALMTKSFQEAPETKRGDNETMEAYRVRVQKHIAAGAENLRVAHDRIKAATSAGGPIDTVGLSKGEDVDVLLRSGDSTKIKQSMEKYAGAVSAMKDIFGDAGNPDAPMRQLINGLQALTQSSLGQVSPAQLAATVRKVHELGKITGLGIEGIAALTTSAAAIVEAEGGNRVAGVAAGIGGAAYGQAYKNMGMGNVSIWGNLDQERVTILDTKLRAHALGSRAANNVGALMRMQAKGLISEGSEAAAAAEAIAGGNATYKWKGAEKSVGGMSFAGFQALAATGGVSAATARAVYEDKFGNQEYAPADLIRGMQADEAGERIGSRLTGVIKGQLKGMKGPAGFEKGMGIRVGKAMMQIDKKIWASEDPEALELEKQRIGKQALTDELRARGMSEAVIAKKIASVNWKEYGLAIESGATEAVRHDNRLRGTGNWRGAAQSFSKEALADASRVADEAASKGAIAEAFADVGRGGPLARVMDELSGADADTPWSRVVAAAFGEDTNEIESADPAVRALRESIARIEGGDAKTRADETKFTTALVGGGEAIEKWKASAAKHWNINADSMGTGIQGRIDEAKRKRRKGDVKLWEGRKQQWAAAGSAKDSPGIRTRLEEIENKHYEQIAERDRQEAEFEERYGFEAPDKAERRKADEKGKKVATAGAGAATAGKAQDVKVAVSFAPNSVVKIDPSFSELMIDLIAGEIVSGAGGRIVPG